MTDSEFSTSSHRTRRELDREDFEALLVALAPDRERAGEQYEELRRRLMNLFAWEKFESTDRLADEVLNRLARRLAEGAEIPHIDRFAFGIARLVMQEEARGQRQFRSAALELESSRKPASSDLVDAGSSAEDSVRACLDSLPADRRELIERYYTGDRATLARELGLSMNALRNRAMRVRSEIARRLARRRDK